jgi:CRISPR/Cas system CSM-associated protein Csm3 (group 7 of RAMP superfamily)
MARPVQARITVTGKLVTTTPLHVGGYGESFDTDLPLARDGAGGFYVPGTSLAGPMRLWCLSAFHEKETKDLFGYQKEDEGHASFLMVEDAPVRNVCDEMLNDYETEIRDGVGINRRWGVAENRIKFDRAILPRGSKLDFRISVDVEDDADENKAREKFKTVQSRLGHLLQALIDGEVPFGAAKTRGFGRARLVSHEIRLQKRKGKDFLKHLRAGGEVSSVAQLKAADVEFQPKQPARLTVTIRWEPSGALMVKSGAGGIGVDMLPLISGKDGSVALVLPGSSVKGALRAHAERITRTVRNECLEDEEFEKQLTHIPLICDMFGRSKPPESEHSKDGNIGTLAVRDCYAEKVLLREQWQAVTAAKEKALQDELDKISDAGIGMFEQMPHVAVDRWTGGAADSMLFSVLEPRGINWEPIVLTLDLQPRRNAEKRKEDEKAEADRLDKDAALALLFLLLRDMAAGRVPLGFAVNRGMGEIKINSIEFTGENLKGYLSALKNKPVVLGEGGGFFKKLDASELLDKLNKAWQTWHQ